MSAEHDDLPAPIREEVQAFTDVNVAWLGRMLISAGIVGSDDEAGTRARAIFASIAGAQLVARSRSDITLFDTLVEAYQSTGLLPA